MSFCQVSGFSNPANCSEMTFLKTLEEALFHMLAEIDLGLVFPFSGRGRQLRTAALQPVPAGFATVRITMKALSDGLPRVSGSAVLFKADEFRVINFCPAANGVSNTRMRRGRIIFRDSRCWSRMVFLRVFRWCWRCGVCFRSGIF